jgi:hypothetical protein
MPRVGKPRQGRNKRTAPGPWPIARVAQDAPYIPEVLVVSGNPTPYQNGTLTRNAAGTWVSPDTDPGTHLELFWAAGNWQLYEVGAGNFTQDYYLPDPTPGLYPASTGWQVGANGDAPGPTVAPPA